MPQRSFAGSRFTHMQFDTVQQICLSLPLVTESFPFDEDTLVWKVAGKMFCLGSIRHFESVNLKCEPAYAAELRERYTQIQPGYHMNKTLWNTVYFDGLHESLIRDLIIHSYDEVVRKLPLKVQKEIQALR